jgi:acyl carrier protein
VTTTLATLQQLIASKFGLSVADLDPAKPFAEFGLDSLGMIELLFDIGDHFDVNLPDDRPLNNLSDLAALVDEVLSKKSTV